MSLPTAHRDCFRLEIDPSKPAKISGSGFRNTLLIRTRFSVPHPVNESSKCHDGPWVGIHYDAIYAGTFLFVGLDAIPP